MGSWVRRMAIPGLSRRLDKKRSKNETTAVARIEIGGAMVGQLLGAADRTAGAAISLDEQVESKTSNEARPENEKF